MTHRIRPVIFWRSIRLALLVCVVSTTSSQSPEYAAINTTQEACAASGYCSLHTESSHFMGPVGSNVELKSAMQALAYRNEIIMVMEFRADAAAQFLSSYQSAGYGHVLVLTDSESLCHLLGRVFRKLGCGWYPVPVFKDPKLSKMFTDSGIGQKLYLKIWFGARIIRMGYNILIADSDTAVSRDFYQQVKQPPLSEIQCLINPDGHGSLNVNSGFLYIQNASPNGPIAWAFSDALIRQARFNLDMGVIKALGPRAGYSCWDQPGLNDALYSTIVGRPFFGACMRVSDDHGDPNQQSWEELWSNMQITAANSTTRMQSKMVNVTDTNRDIVGAAAYHLDFATMQLPHIYGQKAIQIGLQGWPKVLGGQVYGDVAMPPSVADIIQEHLVNDIDTPLWPDLENASTAAAADKQPTENFAFFPSWLVTTYVHVGRLGGWNPKLTQNSTMVIGHVWQNLPNGGSTRKRTVFACSDLHNHDVSAKLHGHDNGVYPGCSYPHAKFPPLVAYAPGFFDHTTSQDDYGFAVADLARIAVTSKHIIGWPGAPLAASWTHHSKNNTEGYGINGKPHVIPWHYINTDVFMAFTPYDSLKELSGIWNAMFSEGCTHNNERRRRRLQSVSVGNSAHQGRNLLASYHHGYVAYNTCIGLLPMDLKHFLSKLSVEASTPGPHNSFQIPDGSLPGQGGVIQISSAHIKAESKRMEGQPIVWLTKHFQVPVLESKDEELYTVLSRECCAVQYAEYKNHTNSDTCNQGIVEQSEVLKTPTTKR